jgi:D-3-phosphoglycerate dehydrogenase
LTTSFSKSRMKILLLEGVHDRAVENFKRHGYTAIERHKKALAGDELRDAVAGAHFVGIRSRTRLTEDVIAAAPRLMSIGAFCIGTNQIDLDAAMMRGIPVFNAPFSNTRSVAELVLAEIIFLLRGIPAKNALLHRGVWAKSADDAREVRGKTLGIVGYGNIGTQLSVMAEALGMDVCFYDIVTKLPLGNARMMPSLEELLEVPWSASRSRAPPSTCSRRSRRGTTRSSCRPCARSTTSSSPPTSRGPPWRRRPTSGPRSRRSSCATATTARPSPP